MNAESVGLVLRGDDFLMPVERGLLRAVLLDVDGAGALRLPVDSPAVKMSQGELSGLSDAELIGRFNEYVDALLGADWLVQVYDVCRPEVRALLSDAPVDDLRYWRSRHGTSMADEDVERAVRCLLGAGLFGLLEDGCVPVLSLPALLRPACVRRLVLVGRGVGRVPRRGVHCCRLWPRVVVGLVRGWC